MGHGALYHSQSPEAYFCHTPGLVVVMPRYCDDDDVGWYDSSSDSNVDVGGSDVDDVDDGGSKDVIKIFTMVMVLFDIWRICRYISLGFSVNSL